MEKQRKILKSPSVKRRNRTVPVNQRVTLERVIGLTAASNATLACDANTGTIAYPAGCVVVLFNPRRTKQSHILNFSKKTLTAVAFSPDGKHIVTGESGHQPAVRVWNVEEKSQVSELHGHKFGINCVAFSPNLKYLVSIGSQHDMMVNVWNWKTGTKVASNKISSKVNAVAFSEDGSMFVTVGNRHVKFWYLDSSKSRINETVPLMGRSGILGDQKNNYFCDVVCGKRSVSNCVFTITQAGLLCQFNEKRLLDKWVELRTNMSSCLSAGEDYIFIGCANGVVRVFDAHTLHYIATLPHPHYLGVDVASALSPSNMISRNEDVKYPDTLAVVFDEVHRKVSCVYNDHSLYMWDVHDVKKVGKAWSFLYHSSCVWGLEVAPSAQENEASVLPSGSFITCSSDGTIRIWNIDPHMKPTASYKRNVYSNELLKILYIDPTLTSLRDVNYNPAGGTDKTDTKYGGKNGIRSVCISPSGCHLASGDRIGNVRIHDLKSAEELHTIEAHDGEVLCLEYSAFNTGPKLLSSTSRDRLVHVFDTEQKYGLLQTLDDHSSSITAVKFTENDNQLKMLSCGADKSLLFRSAQMDPEFQFTLSQHLVSKTTLYDMDVDPTHKYVATACQDRNIRIHNIKTGKQKKSYKGSIGDDGTLIRLSLDPSGSFVATTCTDKNLCVLDFCSGELVATSYGHSELSTGIKFTNDLKHLISVSGDGCIFVWRLSGEMTRQMQGRLEGIGQLPVEAQDHKNVDKTSNMESLEFKSPTKILQELTHENELRSPDKSLDYRFSVSELPKWAKAEGEIGKTKEESSTKDDPDIFRPDGQWAHTVDNRKVLLAKLNNRRLHSSPNRNTRKYTAEYYDDADGEQRRETMVLPKPQNTPRKIPVIIDDEDSGDDDDDEEDFFPSFHKKRDDDSIWEESFKSRPTDQDTRNSWSTKRQSFNFNRNDSIDDLEELDSETPELIYYPPSEADSTETNGTSFTVFAGNSNALSKSKKTLSQSSGQEKSLDGDSESTDPVSIEDVDDDDDLLSIPSNPATPSEELAMKTPEREKFLKDTFENFLPIENFEKSLEDMEKNLDTSQTGDLLTNRLSISSRFLSRAQQSSIRNTSASGELQRQDNWFDLILKEIFGYRRLHACYRRLQSVQKRKDAMARAVDETRKRLLAMGWKDKSPEPEKPEVPDVKVTPGEEAVKEQTTPTNRAPSSTSSSSQSYQRPRTPTSLRRCWSTFDLPKTPIVEEKPRLTLSVSNPSTPLSKSPHGKTSSAIPKCSGNSASSATKNKPLWRSRIPTPTSVSSRHTSPRAVSNRGSVWDTRSEGSDDSVHKTTTNRTETSPIPPPRGRKSRPSTLTLDKKKEGSDNGGRTTPKLTPRSHSHSSLYRKQTESSKAKTSKANSSSNLLKEDKKDLPKTSLSKCTSMQNISNSKLSLTKTKSKLSSSKLSSLYTSTPNLANDFLNDSDEIESSNLKFSGRLSGSVPDLLDEGSDKSSNKSEKSRTSSSKRSDSKRYSSGTLPLGKKTTKGESRISSSSKSQRLSLPTGVTSVNIDGTRKSARVKKDDKDLMPPPVKGSVVKSKQEEFIKKAVQSKRKQPQTTSEMTLDMAKNILRGKSGILESEESSCDSSVNSSEIDLPAKTAHVTTTSSFSSGTATFTSTFPAYTTASTTSVVYTVSSSVTSSTLSSATVSSSIEPFLHNNPNILKVAAEIESTVADMGHKSALETAFQNLAVLDASPHDLPERDTTPAQVTSSMEDSGVGQTSTVKSYCDDNKIGSDWRINTTSHSSGIDGDEEVDLPPTASIKDRIALLTSHASPRISHHGANAHRNSSATLTSYLSITPTRTTTNSSRGDGSSSVGMAGLSPRSSSGIGSSLDSEAATKLFTSPGSSLSPQSNYDLAHTETHNVSDSEDMSSKDSPKGIPQSLYTSEMEFTSSNSFSLADALDVSSAGHSVTSHSSILLPLSAPNSTQLGPSRSSSVISSKSPVIGSPRLNATGSPRSNMNSAPITNGFHSSEQDNQGNLEMFVQALKDLRQAAKKVTVLYKQVQLGDDSSAEEANKLLEEAVTETHETFAKLVPKDKISSSAVQTPEGPVSMDVLEPVLSRYSEQLSDRVLEILNNRKGEIL